MSSAKLFIEDPLSNFPYMRACSRWKGSYSDYTEAQIQIAMEIQAPKNTVFLRKVVGVKAFLPVLPEDIKDPMISFFLEQYK